jgi:hypothetical protein
MSLVQLLFFVANLFSAFLVLFPDIYSPLVTVPGAPMIAGMKKHFPVHSCWFSILWFLYYKTFSVSFFITLLSESISKFFSKQILSVLFLITMSGLLAETYLFVPHNSIVLLITYLLTPWCRILFEKPIVTQLVKNIPLSYGIRRFITVFTQARHWTLS